jgi:Glycosyl transferase family 2
MKYYLTIFTMFKNEKRYLKEWIDFHLLIGFEHIYLCDDCSTDEPLEVLRPYMDKKLITYFTWKDEPKPSFSSRNYFVDTFKHETYWTAFIDIDEFLFCSNQEDKISEKIKEYEQFSGLGINCYAFGNSGLKKYDERLVTEKFIYRSEDTHRENTYIKTISKPITMDRSSNPHYANYITGYAVNENKEKITGSNCVNNNKIFRINHYSNKSEEEYYNFKFKPNEGRSPVLKASYDKYNSECIIEDRLIQRYLKDLKNVD